MKLARIAAALFLVLICDCTLAQVIYVAADAKGKKQDGKTWGTAYKSIASAVKAQKRGGTLWVKGGIYRERVLFSTHYSIYGGFGGNEKTLTQRIPDASPTVIDAEYKGSCIVAAKRIRVNMDSIIIMRGSAVDGGGIRCDTDSVVNMRQCVVENCRASRYGGGVYFGKYASGSATACVFRGNTAAYGGGMVVEYHCYPKLSFNEYSHNHAAVSGGGVYCPFHSGAHLINCTLACNTSAQNGGGIYTYYGGPVKLERCIVAFNAAPLGAGAFGGGYSSQTTFTDCSFFGNDAGDFGGNIPNLIGRYGNVTLPPLFVSPDLDDFRLQPDSPCTGLGAYPVPVD